VQLGTTGSQLNKVLTLALYSAVLSAVLRLDQSTSIRALYSAVPRLEYLDQSTVQYLGTITTYRLDKELLLDRSPYLGIVSRYRLDKELQLDRSQYLGTVTRYRLDKDSCWIGALYLGILAYKGPPPLFRVFAFILLQNFPLHSHGREAKTP
jgi:hypothetical protein